MKRLIFFLFSLILISSCKKNFASFQQSPKSIYSYKKNTVKPTSDPAINEPILMASIDDSPAMIEQNGISFSETQENETKTPLQDNDKKTSKKKGNLGRGKFIEKIFAQQTHKSIKIAPKKQNPVPLNSTIYTGFLILGIAVLLALLSLNSLSLLFGLASIIFIYIGFKQYFRKVRRRNIFK